MPQVRDPAVLFDADAYLHAEQVAALQRKGERIGPRQRSQIEGWEETEPFEHPWRRVQVEISRTLPCFDLVRRNCNEVRPSLASPLQLLGSKRRSAHLNELRRFLDGVLDAQAGVCQVFRSAASAMSSQGVPPKEAARIAAMSVRHLAAIRRQNDGTVQDLLQDLDEPENYWDPALEGNWAWWGPHQHDKWSGCDCTGPTDMGLDLGSAADYLKPAVRRYIQQDIGEDPAAEATRRFFFLAVRKSTYLLQAIELDTIDYMGQASYNWEDIALAARKNSGQSAHSFYKMRLEGRKGIGTVPHGRKSKQRNVRGR